MPTAKGTWRTTLLALFAVYVIVGVVFLTMPLALVIWLLLGVALAFGLYFSGERFVRWGVGDR